MLADRTLFLRIMRWKERGVTMLEVLVTILIVTFGLLGLGGLQARAQLAEVEAYSRAQAIVLLQDIVDRINANRKNSMSYVTAAALGTGNPVQNCAGMTRAARRRRDLRRPEGGRDDRGARLRHQYGRHHAARVPGRRGMARDECDGGTCCNYLRAGPVPYQHAAGNSRARGDRLPAERSDDRTVRVTP